MKFGIRRPSLTKSIAARTSVSRVVRHNLGFKAPHGMGWITNPKKAAYNRVYNRTSFSLGRGKGGGDALVFLAIFGVFILIFKIVFTLLSEIVNLFPSQKNSTSFVEGQNKSNSNHLEGNNLEVPFCPNCSSGMIKRISKRGANKGNEFWGCLRFPRCIGTEDIK